MKCTKCQRQWELSSSMSMLLPGCPFCGASLDAVEAVEMKKNKPPLFDNSKDALAYILQEHGINALLGPQLRSLLCDYAPRTGPLQKNVISSVSTSGAADILRKKRSANAAEQNLAFRQAVQKIVEEHGTDQKLVENILLEFTDVLGWKITLDPPKAKEKAKEEEKPKRPEKEADKESAQIERMQRIRAQREAEQIEREKREREEIARLEEKRAQRELQEQERLREIDRDADTEAAIRKAEQWEIRYEAERRERERQENERREREKRERAQRIKKQKKRNLMIMCTTFLLTSLIGFLAIGFLSNVTISSYSPVAEPSRISDQETNAIEAVNRLISNFPDTISDYALFESAISDAYLAYEKLDSALQKRVENTAKLLAAKEGLNAYLAKTAVQGAGESSENSLQNISTSGTQAQNPSAGTYDSSDTLTFSEGNGGWAVSARSDMRYALSGDIVIPSEYRGQPVRTIPEGAFVGCTGIRSIVVPDSVTGIAEGAFSGCIGLQSITLPFVGASRDASGKAGHFGYIFGTDSYSGGMKIPQYHGTYSFPYDYYIPNQLREVTITDAVQLSYGAFQNCSMLTTINLNDEIIGAEAATFTNCSGITTINIPGLLVINESMFEGCSSLAVLTLSESVMRIEQNAFKGCLKLTSINSGLTGTIVIGNSVQSIGYSAFGGCIQIQSITLPFVGASRDASGKAGHFGYIFGTDSYSGGMKIPQYHGTYSFPYDYYIPNQLREVTIADAVQLSYGAFQNCSMLSYLAINSSAGNSIGDKAFDGCVDPIWY